MARALSLVWTWGSAPIELCPFHVDMRLFRYFTAIYLGYGTLCYPVQLAAAVALAPRFSRIFEGLKSRLGLNWWAAGAWLLLLIAAGLAAVMAGIIIALALWPAMPTYWLHGFH
ncbi:Troponin C [Symbiodinium pilosum]|uniref:Troponin C protein n=1 Tax=Symbiodinium pilosum TaxID=2952 RepID=A0A812TD67_SYMPI|nr:Troponin C [Symbiodinium pilosum]